MIGAQPLARAATVAVLLWILAPSRVVAGGLETLPMPAIQIGQLTSQTGNNPAGRDGEDGARQAIAEINAAGGLLGGRSLELRIEDDRTSVEAGIAAFDRLSRSGVSAIVGSSFSNVSLALIPHVEQARIPYVSTGAADGQVEPVHPYMYMTSLSGRLVGEQLLRFLRGLGVRRLAVVYDADSRFARSSWERQHRALARFHLSLIDEAAVHVDTEEFGTVLAGIQSSRAQAVMAWLTGPPAVAFARAFHRAGMTLPLVMSHGAASRGFIAAVGDAGEGIYVATSLALVADQAPASPAARLAQSMSRHFRDAHGQTPSQFAVDAYVAVRIIAAAIERAGSDDPRAIQATLDTLTLATPQGIYRYAPDNHSGLRVGDIAVAQIRHRAFVLTGWSRRLFATEQSQETVHDLP